MKKTSYVILFLATGLILFNCSGNKEKKVENSTTRTINVPAANADSLYAFVDTQVNFGPRVPNTNSHKIAGDYFIASFKKYGAAVTVQAFESQSFDGIKLNLRNIIASYNPEKQKRILLAAHWDTRPFADKDKLKIDGPMDGANDGGSGVAVLLEMARVFSKNKNPEVGIDFILFDGEDWGEKDRMNRIATPEGLASWWCLGSQYWAKHKHKTNYSAYYGILVDMVGAKGSTFFREGSSLEYAPKIVEKVWNAADRIGQSAVFIKQNVGGITDDHIFVNQFAKIPMIDIVHYHATLGFFGDYHHTQKDNLSIIDKKILAAVANTLLNVVYYEE